MPLPRHHFKGLLAAEHGLVFSEYQSDTVEKFEQAPAKKKQQQDAIATGLGDDIARKIQQKKHNQSWN
jgi:hypothetical protein